MDIKVVGRPTELYKRGVKGEVRVWRMEEGETEDGQGAHRVVSGIKDGTMTESGWTICEPKNVGRSNATTSKEQARQEILNLYKIKSERGYFPDIDQIDNVPFVKPMLATDWDKRKAKVDISDGVYVQPKLDGIRCIARADGLWTRTGKPIIAVPHIFEALSPLFDTDPDLVLDGELYNHDLREDFNTITSVVRKAKPKDEDVEKARELIQYHIYDMPSHDGGFFDRWQARPALPLEASPVLQYVETIWADMKSDVDMFYSEWMEAGYEGQMIRLNEPYQFKRSNFLMKRKDFTTEEFEVLDMEEGKGNWAGCIKRFIVALPNGNTCEATPRGTQEALRKLRNDGVKPDWATVRHFGYTPDGKLRFPIAVDYGHGARVD